jgi:hypothetical protein
VRRKTVTNIVLSKVATFLVIVFILTFNLTYGQVKVTSTVKVIGKNANQIFSFIQSCNKEKYQSWHIEHKSFRFVKKTKDYINSEIYFKEVIKGFKVNYTWKVQQVEQGKFIKLKAKYFYPVYLVLTFKDEPDGVFVQQDLIMGKENQFFKLNWLIRKFIITKNVSRNLQIHFVEEFKNLENLIED